MAWLVSSGWKVGLILALFLLLFVFRGLSGGKPDLGSPVRRRRRAYRGGRSGPGPGPGDDAGPQQPR